MNAQQWLIANVGKRIQVTCYQMPEYSEVLEECEGILEEPYIFEHGWEVQVNPSLDSWGFDYNNRGSSTDNTAIIDCRISNGKSVRFEFKLLN